MDRTDRTDRTDRIELRGMSFSGRHGARSAERERAQEFKVDVDVEADLSRPSRSDDLADTIDYTRIRRIAKQVIEGPPASLLEALAGRIADRVLEIEGVRSVSVRVSKFPPSMQPIEAAAVRINRTRA